MHTQRVFRCGFWISGTFELHFFEDNTGKAEAEYLHIIYGKATYIFDKVVRLYFFKDVAGNMIREFWWSALIKLGFRRDMISARQDNFCIRNSLAV